MISGFLEKEFMKRLPLTFFASVAMVVTAGSAFGQIEQVEHRQNRNYVGYETSDWSQCDNCQNGHHRGGRGNGNGNPLTRSMSTKAYPDSGWAPPVNYPVNYDGTWYGAYHPQAFYGSPGGGFIANYPTVYQPNDTTQLGYSYMKVPTWQTRTDMIPPVPVPGNYHNRGCNNGCGPSGQHGMSSGPSNPHHFVAYQPHFSKNMLPAPTPSSLTTRFVRKIQSVSLTGF